MKLVLPAAFRQILQIVPTSLLFLVLSACASLPDPAQSNSDFISRYYEEVFNRRNLAFIDAACVPDVVGHGPGAEDRIQGVAAVRQFSAYVYEVYDDYSLEVDELVAQGDRVVVRATVNATHKPTGQRVRFFGLSIYRLEGGRIAEYWRAYDRLDLYDRQLGGWRPGS